MSRLLAHTLFNSYIDKPVQENQTLVLQTVADKFGQFQPCKVKSTITQDLSINWGDGTSDTVSLLAGVLTSLPQHQYSSPYGSGVAKTVIYTFETVINVAELVFAQCGLVGDFDANVASFLGLKILLFSDLAVSGGGLLDSIPLSILDVTTLTTYSVFKTFNSTSPFFYNAPEGVFDKPIQYFGQVHNNALNDSSNINRVGEFGDTLIILVVGQQFNQMTNIPSEWSSLVNLQVFQGESYNLINDPSSVINNWSSLLQLRLSFAQSWGWGTISSSVIMQLVVFQYGFPRHTGTLTSVPSYFQYFKSGIIVDGRAVEGWGTAEIDAHINSFAAIVDTYASKSAGSTPLRNVVWHITDNGTPSGTYQEPSGYVAGSSNGTPASPLEWVWVLVNQYGWTVTYS